MHAVFFGILMALSRSSPVLHAARLCGDSERAINSTELQIIGVETAFIFQSPLLCKSGFVPINFWAGALIKVWGVKINDKSVSRSFLLGVSQIQPALDYKLAKALSQQLREFPRHFGPLFSSPHSLCGVTHR